MVLWETFQLFAWVKVRHTYSQLFMGTLCCNTDQLPFEPGVMSSVLLIPNIESPKSLRPCWKLLSVATYTITCAFNLTGKSPIVTVQSICWILHPLSEWRNVHNSTGSIVSLASALCFFYYYYFYFPFKINCLILSPVNQKWVFLEDVTCRSTRSWNVCSKDHEQ